MVSLESDRFRGWRAIVAIAAGTFFFHTALAAAEEAIPIKVVVVSMYEIGNDTGDAPGEMQFWVERGGFERKLPFPAGWRDLYLRSDGTLLVCTGGGVTNATSTIMALGLDPRFDLAKAYWIVAGIAGADPEDCSLGSAAWARWVVDGDLAYEIDAREIPSGWPYGFVALGAHEPNTLEDGWSVETMAYELDRGLVDWAYSLTRDVDLGDDPEIAAFREQFVTFPKARRPPFVLIGDSLGASTYWHGATLTRWANDWVKLHSHGTGNFVMSNMEDNGTLTALHRLSKAGRVDAARALVLRTASNYCRPPADKPAVWSTTAPYPAKGRPALEAAYRIANTVVEALVDGWDSHGYSQTIPGG